MTLTELRYLVALHQQRHFARAAEACHVTQSTLSAGIKHLEDSLGLTLVERSRQFLQFTTLGELVVEHAQDILARSDDLLRLVKTNDPLQGELSLGIIFTIAPYLLPKLILPWRDMAAKTPLRLTEGYTHELLHKLTQGELDAAIIALPYPGTDDFTAWQLYREPFVAVLPEQHRLCAKQRLSLTDIQDEPLLILGQGHCFRDHALSAIPHVADHPWQSLIEGSSLETIRAMVAGGMGVTLMPSLAAAHNWQGLVSIPLESPAPFRDVVLIARSTHSRREALRLLAQTIKQLTLIHPDPNPSITH
jgi:LysR family hydrogen peroxide-inducible transcriptional activator